MKIIAFNVKQFFADKFIKANLNPLNKGVFSCIASNNIKNELILYFISLLLSNFNSCTNNYQVIDNLFYFFLLVESYNT